MAAVPFVLRAHVLQNVAIRYQHLFRLHREWLRVRLEIVDSQLQIHMAEITPSEPLPNPQLLALRVPKRIQPALVVESFRIHDQDIALPMADRITHPGRLRINGKHAAISVYLAVRVALFVENSHECWRLNDLERKIIVKVTARNALRNTAR